MDTHGQYSGQPGSGSFVGALVGEHGSLAAVAERLAATRGHVEDVAGIERALRRLRSRGATPGGLWGARLLRTFGLPVSIDARLRFMGSYHSRFVDLPVPLCTDLVQLGDRPPTSETKVGRLWLSLARAVIAFRERAPAEARLHLTVAAAAADDPCGRIEIALGRAHLETVSSPNEMPRALDPVEGLLAGRRGSDAICLRARYANGLAYVRFRLGDPAGALVLARAAAIGRALGDAVLTGRA